MLKLYPWSEVVEAFAAARGSGRRPIRVYGGWAVEVTSPPAVVTATEPEASADPVQSSRVPVQVRGRRGRRRTK